MKVVFSKGGISDRWSWTLYSNGQVMAVSRKGMGGYMRRIDCIKSFQRLRKTSYIQGVVENSFGDPITCYGL
jgi:uncharacterized protein YegP (UPF0339 family)